MKHYAKVIRQDGWIHRFSYSPHDLHIAQAMIYQS